MGDMQAIGGEVVEIFKITLRAARVNGGLSQAQVEAKTGYARSTLTRWESGKGFPKIEDLMRLCELYGIPGDMIKSEKKPGGRASHSCTGRVKPIALEILREAERWGASAEELIAACELAAEQVRVERAVRPYNGREIVSRAMDALKTLRWRDVWNERDQGDVGTYGD